ncbi:hypothetical protein [Oceanithermus profundus]|uniref:Uncharacterized protein n=1 Tax=Oceanithermus profundus (strain DSM 14977 / NBRC 100410 / VKM B-2274 / 506) TaxID=670487 RepID=E4U4B5_OCEP5|nr:hypothetical protein [Oceanithermus profundus]ADR36200.1 hypothetical protein Ocepr_0743 [Oceanithermus profundus DSM 14977]
MPEENTIIIENDSDVIHVQPDGTLLINDPHLAEALAEAQSLEEEEGFVRFVPNVGCNTNCNANC